MDYTKLPLIDHDFSVATNGPLTTAIARDKYGDVLIRDNMTGTMRWMHPMLPSVPSVPRFISEDKKEHD